MYVCSYVNCKSEINMFKPNNLIESHDCNSEINSRMRIDEICENFTNIFINFCKICIPFNKVLIRPNDKPWFTYKQLYQARITEIKPFSK